jgi:hypothetical protein
VNTLEDRLRDAYRAAAETVRPETVLPNAILSPPGRDRHQAWRAGHGRPRTRLLVPLTAAAAVIAVAAAVAVLLPRAAPGLGRGKAAEGPAARALLTTPAYFVELEWNLIPSMYVVDAATGAQVSRISLPFPATYLTNVATGDGRTFVVAATTQSGCSTTLYRFTLAANGTPSAMTPFTTIDAPIGQPFDIAVSENARFIAYQASACGPRTNYLAELNKGYLAVLDTVTGHTKRWTFQTTRNGYLAGGTGNVSISANGSVIGFTNEVIDTSAAPGSLAARGRVVATDGEFGPSTELGGLNISPDGKTAYFETNKVAHGMPVWGSWQLRAVDLATGLTRLVRSFPGREGSPAAATFDPTGRYMLVYSLTEQPMQPARLDMLDIATGQLTRLHAASANLEIAW